VRYDLNCVESAVKLQSINQSIQHDNHAGKVVQQMMPKITQVIRNKAI